MSEVCETVKVKCEASEANPAGEMVINKSDYDEDVHELVGGGVVGEPGAKSNKQLAVDCRAVGINPAGMDRGAMLDAIAKKG
jgi:hypothetical protein